MTVTWYPGNHDGMCSKVGHFWHWQSGIKCVKLDGSMSMQARDQMIERFTNDPDCKVSVGG